MKQGAGTVRCARSQRAGRAGERRHLRRRDGERRTESRISMRRAFAFTKTTSCSRRTRSKPRSCLASS
jgi:hypothetical protein